MSLLRRALFRIIAVVLVLQLGLWLMRPSRNSSAWIDAVVVPGGGLTASGDLHPFVKARFDVALRVPAKLRGFIVALSAGTSHKPPPRTAEGFPVSEARAGAAYLLEAGVDPDSILVEELSLDTIGNAFWLRLLHTDPRRLRRLHIVTNFFHSERTRYIFERVFSLPMAAGAWSSFWCAAVDYELTFESAADVNVTGLTEREKREAESLAMLKEPTSILSRADSMETLHRLMHTEHGAYRIGRKALGSTRIAAIDSY
jgi:uncharacterized SAM-binding protein YcdF (DUF218 family)